MEIKKTSVSSITQPEIPQKSEVSKTKSSGQNLIPDSFETSKSSEANRNSTASSEPEKKAGQITGGILIKQMTAAQLGEGFAKKELSPEQQSRVSNSDPQKENLKPSYFLQDARSRSEDSKNSGLQAPFASKKEDTSSKISNAGKDQIIASLGQGASEQTSNAVKDANRLVDGGTLRSQVDAEVAERHQDSNALGGTTTDRLSDLLNPTAGGPQQSSQSGASQFAHGTLAERQAYADSILEYMQKHSTKTSGNDQDYVRDSTRQNPDGTTTNIHEEAGNLESGGTYSVKQEDTVKNGTRIIDTKKTEYRGDDTKVETHEKSFYDANGNFTKSTKTTTTTKSDGTVIVETSTTKPNKDGSTTTNTTTTTTPGGGAKSYDQENYTGNIPDEVKKTMDYFKQQAIGQKPQSGGETAHTDDNAAADPTVGGRVSNLVAQQGNLGLFGNPGSATSQTGPSGGQGHVGSSQSGGNVDFGPDSDQVGYTGPTHQDDPADVQFGPAEQPKEQTSAKKNEESDDSTFSIFDPLRKNRRDI